MRDDYPRHLLDHTRREVVYETRASAAAVSYYHTQTVDDEQYYHTIETVAHRRHPSRKTYLVCRYPAPLREGKFLELLSEIE